MTNFKIVVINCTVAAREDYTLTWTQKVKISDPILVMGTWIRWHLDGEANDFMPLAKCCGKECIVKIAGSKKGAGMCRWMDLIECGILDFSSEWESNWRVILVLPFFEFLSGRICGAKLDRPIFNEKRCLLPWNPFEIFIYTDCKIEPL